MRARRRYGLACVAGGQRGVVLCGVVLCGAWLAALLALAAPAQAQEQTPPDSARADTVRRDTVRRDTVRRDTTRRGAGQPDSLARALREPGRGAGLPGGEGEAGEAVRFSARDSLIIVLGADTTSASDTSNAGTRGDVGTLYGESKVDQRKVTLTAYQVKLLFDREVMRATGPPGEGRGADTTGLPRFERGEGQSFTGRRLSFDLKTRRGRIVEARTRPQQREGFVEGEVVQVEEDSTVFIGDGLYTTCNCPRGQTPSYSLRGPKMKVQGDWVYTGPIQLFIFNIPTPLVLPFAFLPAVSGRSGGVIFPSYGSQDDLGFYLRDFGYYFPISDYMDLQLTGSLWSRGSWAVSPTFRYTKRYAYDGNLQVDYQRRLAGDVVDANNINSTNAKIRWSHSQQFVPRQAPNASSLRASVDLASRTYRQVISDDFQDNVTRRTSSSVNFSKNWNDGNQKLDVNLTQSQNLTSGRASLTLPDVGFSQRSIQPFKRERRGPGQEERWYEKLTTSYDAELENSFDFNPLSENQLRERQGVPDSVSSDSLDRPGVAWYGALFSQEKYRRATGDETQRFDFSVTHNVPLSMNFRLPRYQLNVNPRLSYEETWLPNTVRKRRVAADTTVTDEGVQEIRYETVEREEPGFFAQREFNLSLGANTTFYGLFPVEVGPLEGLRHEVQPSLSFSYRPDYTTDFFGRTRSYLDEDGERVRYDIVDGGDVFGADGSRSINFDLRNEFETKEVSTDSTGARQEETLRLFTLDTGASYNFKADSLRLSDVSVGLDFPVLSTKFNVDASARLSFSPYVYSDEGRQLNRLVVSETGGFPAQLTDFDFSISTDFQGGEGEDRRDDRFDESPVLDESTGGIGQVPDPAPRNVPGRSSLRQGVGQYANFAIPWSLDVRLDYSFSNRARFEQSDFSANANFNFNLTPRWKVSGRTGYDFDRGELTPTRLSMTRDFRCWQMSFSWQPFSGSSLGRGQSYSFNLYVKSGVLRDLLNLRLPRNEGRGFGDRLRGVARGAVQQAGR